MRSNSFILAFTAAAIFLLAGKSFASGLGLQAIAATQAPFAAAPAQGGGLGGIGGYDANQIPAPQSGKKNKRLRQQNP